jgi:hypothetical protein
MTEIFAFVTAVGHAVNIAKAIVDTRDATKLGELTLQFITAVLDIAQKQLALTEGYQATLDANKDLKQKLAAYDRWEQECQRYERHQPEPGFVVYALKPEHASGQKPHWLCATCYHDRETSILHPLSKGANMWVCPRDPEHALDMEERL